MFNPRFSQHPETKNILVLGNKGCGKRSFVLFYKDKVTPHQELPEMNSLVCRKTLNNTPISLLFVFKQTNDRLIPSKVTNTHYDLILILTDLSSPDAQGDLNYYKELASIHYPEIDTLLVGTKQDQQLENNQLEGLVCTSIKSTHSLDEFEQQLQMRLTLPCNSPYPSR
jgi:hypothetical protein